MKVKSGIYMSPSRVSKTGLTCVCVCVCVWGGGWWGVDGGAGILDKVVKNCMKITKSTFLGQTKGGYGWLAKLSSGSGWGGVVPLVPPLGETLSSCFSLSCVIWVESESVQY